MCDSVHPFGSRSSLGVGCLSIVFDHGRIRIERRFALVGYSAGWPSLGGTASSPSPPSPAWPSPPSMLLLLLAPPPPPDGARCGLGFLRPPVWPPPTMERELA